MKTLEAECATLIFRGTGLSLSFKPLFCTVFDYEYDGVLWFLCTLGSPDSLKTCMLS